MDATQWTIVVLLAAMTAVVLPATTASAEGESGDCIAIYTSPPGADVHPEECICWPCAEPNDPEGTDP